MIDHKHFFIDDNEKYLHLYHQSQDASLAIEGEGRRMPAVRICSAQHPAMSKAIPPPGKARAA
ncbi:MAG TPA: hypothetical protein VJ832_00860, partial [Variovorax sp.]|nr:hypothetical protein [Variovorax sp.]